jgi:hypothetical protein
MKTMSIANSFIYLLKINNWKFPGISMRSNDGWGYLVWIKWLVMMKRDISQEVGRGFRQLFSLTAVLPLPTSS